jgi:hypothetical protein
MNRFRITFGHLVLRALFCAMLFVMAAAPHMETARAALKLDASEAHHVLGSTPNDMTALAQKQPSNSEPSRCTQRLCLEPMLPLAPHQPVIGRHLNTLGNDIRTLELSGHINLLRTPPPRHQIS